MTTTTPQRIGGWLLGPLAWLLVALLSTTLALLLYTAALSSPQTFQTLGGQALTTQILWGVSFITAIAMWYYTLVVDHRLSLNVGVVFLNTILSGCLFPYCWQ